ncbi:MAG: type III restriction endonuclease subunit M [Bacteroidetes bacterium HGW-Bacteroidetes-1]|jgi:adenine-specific DNA-methyltransferase|nr:MAG: type III restriction endonuclease subunit M [Bacteroidetes bacterium HGW-Bacteroidetes-1]
MPTLNWIGKDKVINHHMDVPYKILEHQYGFDNGEQSSTETNSGNKIIHGDNLEALKSLLPEYEGRIKCIYIDPPYNTGNEGWVYNDNVNDPKFKKWLGNVVGKEAEDLSRHDKWLCMIYPRLKILQKLLSTDGAIFISIDDNEQANLKLICDEIFGQGNFVNNIIWQKKFSPQNDSKYFSDNHDFILCYTKSKHNWNRNLLKRTENQTNRYKNPDNDPRGVWTSSDFTVKTYSKEYDFEIKTPSGNIIKPTEGRCWMTSNDNLQKLLADNRIWFGIRGTNVPRIKKFLSEVNQGNVPVTIWLYQEVGHNQSARQELKQIFKEIQFPFDTPKPKELIERILSITTDKKSIILDSFAGSGTTAHAVLNLNKQDGGHRKFILVEMEDYAENITAERIKRVINGYGIDKKAFEGIGGKFDYYELGKPLFLENDMLNEEVGLKKVREYVWFSETRKPYNVVNTEEEHLLGLANSSAYYFFYYKDKLTTLDDSFLRTIKTKAEQYIIYADNCILDNVLMQKYHITYKKIPRDITRF